MDRTFFSYRRNGMGAFIRTHIYFSFQIWSSSSLLISITGAQICLTWFQMGRFVLFPFIHLLLYVVTPRHLPNSNISSRIQVFTGYIALCLLSCSCYWDLTSPALDLASMDSGQEPVLTFSILQYNLNPLLFSRHIGNVVLMARTPHTDDHNKRSFVMRRRV